MSSTAPPTATVREADLEAIGVRLLERQRSKKRRDQLVSHVSRILAILAILGLWEGVVRAGLVDRFLVSSPVDVGWFLIEYLPSADFWVNMFATAKAVVVGLVLGSVAGIGAGLVLYEWPLLKRSMDPLITFLNSLPRPALAPIFILWFGLGMGGKVAVAVSIVFFVLLLNTVAGLSSTDSRLLMFASTVRMSRLQRLRYIQLPFAVPALMAGLRLGAVYAVLGVVVAEMIASYEGLGQVLMHETNAFHIAGAFGTLVILGVFAMALNAAVTVLGHRVSWQERD